MTENRSCPECDNSGFDYFNRRQFVQVAGTAAVAASLPALAIANEKSKKPASETLVKKLYDSFSDDQKKTVCFDWDHTNDRGLLRTHVSNNWSITDRRKYNVGGAFFSKDQQDLIESIFWGLYNPQWHDRIRKQLKDDAGGYGKAQTIAIFGKPGTDQFEFVMTGRHLTVRCDGNSADHVAFGGPIFYGHAAGDFHEEADHPGNVFWHQALKANALFKMLDGKQRKAALVQKAPQESRVGFQGKKGPLPGIAATELSADQKTHLNEVLKLLVEPYRLSDRKEALQYLKAQGGLDACSIAFYQSDHEGESTDIGDDGVWDVWRLEGPSFVWHYRGAPHVHVWANVADSSSVKLNARG